MIVRVRRHGSGGLQGSYLLVLRLEAPAVLPAGVLGAIEFPAGSYVYCGSALGPGGVRARVRRHVKGAGALHWHIDYLLRHARVQTAWASYEPRRLECEWAAALGAHPEFSCPAPGFGASDCRCRAHLFHTRLSPARLESVLRRLPAAPRPAWPRGGLRDML